MYLLDTLILNFHGEIRKTENLLRKTTFKLSRILVRIGACCRINCRICTRHPRNTSSVIRPKVNNKTKPKQLRNTWSKWQLKNDLLNALENWSSIWSAVLQHHCIQWKHKRGYIGFQNIKHEQFSTIVSDYAVWTTVPKNVIIGCPSYLRTTIQEQDSRWDEAPMETK